MGNSSVVLQDVYFADEYIRKILQAVNWGFFELGRVLHYLREQAGWVSLGCETWAAYLEDLGLSQYQAGRLVAIYELLHLQEGISEDTIKEIGMTKAYRLLPLARAGELSKNTIEQAQTLTDMDLRRELGHKVNGLGESVVVCPRCGVRITGVKYDNVLEHNKATEAT